MEWNSNPEIAEAAERLYGNIENLELYVGLQAEEPKPLVDGAGLCPGAFKGVSCHLQRLSFFLAGYTISRAILSDAIALTRGDRYFTADYTPFNLTAWGFADSQRDTSGPGNGSILGRLLLRGLPGQFTENSSYAWFPLQTPESMEVFLRKLGSDRRYSFNRPSDAPIIATVRSYNDVRQILGSSQFRPFCGDKAARVVSGEGYVVSTDEHRSRLSEFCARFFLASNNDAESQRDQREILRVLRSSPDQADKIAHYFYERTRKLIVSKSYILADKGLRYVDIVRDVLRYVPLYWTATELVCNLELSIRMYLTGWLNRPA